MACQLQRFLTAHMLGELDTHAVIPAFGGRLAGKRSAPPIALLSNPRSQLNRRSPRRTSQLREILGADGSWDEVSTRAELVAAVASIRDSDTRIVALSGGDGTIHVVVTALLNAFKGETLPAIALLPSGTMNNIARSLGVTESPEVWLEQIVEHVQHGRALSLKRVKPLAVAADGRSPLHGFIFASGIAAEFLETFYETPGPPLAATAGVLGQVLLSRLVQGQLAERLSHRTIAQVDVEGHPWPALEYLSVLAGAVREIGLGFEPFLRADERPGAFHIIGITGTTHQLLEAFPRIWLNLPWPPDLAVDAVARKVRITLAEPTRYTIDGDLYDATDSILIESGPTLRMVVP